jgi:hypothetical protein
MIGTNMADKWYYNSRSGIVNHYNEATMWLSLHDGSGWHGPFDTKEATLKYYNDNKAKNSGWKAPTDSVGTGIGNLGDTAVQSVGLGGLTNENITSWFIRIGEVLLGIVLLGVGVAKLTGTTNAVAKLVKAKI